MTEGIIDSSGNVFADLECESPDKLSALAGILIAQGINDPKVFRMIIEGARDIANEAIMAATSPDLIKPIIQVAITAATSAKDARIKKLEEALKPFARIADERPDMRQDALMPVLMSNCRRARDILNEGKING